MRKKMKLKLDELKVQSFITLETSIGNRIKGRGVIGVRTIPRWYCTDVLDCSDGCTPSNTDCGDCPTVYCCSHDDSGCGGNGEESNPEYTCGPPIPPA